MQRTYVVTGAASGIGAATAGLLRDRGARVISADLHDADVIADLTTVEGRAALVDGVSHLCDGRIDAVIANAGGGPPETSMSLNFFGAVATLEGLRPLLESSPAPRAVAVSSIAALRQPDPRLVNACLRMDESAALAAAKNLLDAVQETSPGPPPEGEHTALVLYGNAKYALQRWCRSAAVQPQWAGLGIILNVAALGFYDTPSAAHVLSDPDGRVSMARMVPLQGAFPGQPAEAAELLTWLVAPENSQLTGQILFADGGFECSATAGRIGS